MKHYEFSQNEPHEPHGKCETCLGPCHQYPFGWAHTFVPIQRHDLIIEVTCCHLHARGGAPVQAGPGDASASPIAARVIRSEASA